MSNPRDILEMSLLGLSVCFSISSILSQRFVKYDPIDISLGWDLKKTK